MNAFLAADLRVNLEYGQETCHFSLSLSDEPNIWNDPIMSCGIGKTHWRKHPFVQSLGDIDDLLRQRSHGDYLLGSTFSYAECISAPWVQRFYVSLCLTLI